MEPTVLHSANTTDFLKKRALSLFRIAESMPESTNIEEVPADILLDGLCDATQACMALRAGLINVSAGAGASYKTRRNTALQASQIRISKPDSAVVRLTLPMLVSRQYKGAYDVYWETKYALEKYVDDGGKFDFKVGDKLLLIYKKYTKNISSTITCDNDNWEMKRTTNAICEALGYSDNAKHFSMLYNTVQSDVNMVEATVIKETDIVSFAEYLSCSTH